VRTKTNCSIGFYVGGKHAVRRVCIQKFPDWPPGAITANGTALCHDVQLYRYVVRQSSKFCRYNPLCSFLTSVYCCYCCCCCYRFNPETPGYTLVHTRTYTGTQLHLCTSSCLKT
jgi:hypothetical protein